MLKGIEAPFRSDVGGISRTWVDGMREMCDGIESSGNHRVEISVYSETRLRLVKVD
jgi:hypothetical protein